MKRIFILLISLVTGFSIQAQNTSIVSVNIIGNKNLQVSVSGKQFKPSSSNITGNNTSFVVNNLRMGQHTFQVTRTDQSTNKAVRTSTTFNLRSGYDMQIKLNRNGSLELIETSKLKNRDSQASMTTYDFNKLVNDVKMKISARERRVVIADAFENLIIIFPYRRLWNCSDL
jgi:hypothetical protein